MKTLRNLLLLLLVCIAFSCKKNSGSDNNSDSYVKIKKNGTMVTYTGLGELGPDLGDNTKTDLGISGTTSDAKEVFNISIQMDGSNFPAGTYSSDVYTPYYVIASYVTNPDPNTLNHYDIDDAQNRPPSKYTIIITSITPDYLTGTFTGNYLYNSFGTSDPDGGVVEITEGEFKVKRIR